mmetsp:Transcript_1377/g.3196  ORF Transcript_1377/g.3196 Transcript_1377/m.3196 type:complete len:208 (+) Transcript_1377:691-1314(+)
MSSESSIFCFCAHMPQSDAFSCFPNKKSPLTRSKVSGECSGCSYTMASDFSWSAFMPATLWSAGFTSCSIFSLRNTASPPSRASLAFPSAWFIASFPEASRSRSLCFPVFRTQMHEPGLVSLWHSSGLYAASLKAKQGLSFSPRLGTPSSHSVFTTASFLPVTGQPSSNSSETVPPLPDASTMPWESAGTNLPGSAAYFSTSSDLGR